MPQSAEILTAQMQGDQLCLWALVDPDAKMEKRIILVFGTGHTIDTVGRYIATFQMGGGALIFHVFEPLHPLGTTAGTSAGRQ